MQFSFPAANLQQKLHICKHSGVFSSNKMKFYGLNGHMGRLCSHKNDLKAHLIREP